MSLLVAFAVVAVVVRAITLEDAQAFCQQLRVSGSAVQCTDDRSSVVFCIGDQAKGVQNCKKPHSCRKHDGVPDTCGTDSSVFRFSDAFGQRPNKWRWVPTRIVSTLTNEQKAQKVLNASDYDLYIESTSIGANDNTDDMFFQDIVPIPSLPLGAIIHGIKVYLVARTHLHNVGERNTTEIDGNTYCYVKDLELQTGDVVSGNRGAGEASERRQIGAKFQTAQNDGDAIAGIVFGNRLDTWDEFSDVNNFGHDTRLEIDFKAGVYDDKHVYQHDGDTKNDVSCFVSKAAMEIFYTVTSATQATPVYLVMSGHGALGTFWRYYDGDIDMGKTIPAQDVSQAHWYDIKYEMDIDWKEGQGPFGYDADGDNNMGDEHTHFTHKRRTAYFRTQFSFGGDPSCVGPIFFKLLIDDGAIVWLNGQQLYWYNMDPEHEGPAAYDTRALRDVYHETLAKLAAVPDNVLLLKGNNTLAVEVHQIHPDSTDLAFDMTMWVYSSCNANTATSAATIESPQPTKNMMPTMTTKAGDKPTATDKTDTTPRADNQKTTAPAPAPGDDESSTPRSSSWSVMLLGGIAVGVVLLIAYFVFKRMEKRRAQFRGGSRAAYSSFVEEISPAREEGYASQSAGAAPSSSSIGVPSASSSASAAAASPTTGAKRIVRQSGLSVGFDVVSSV